MAGVEFSRDAKRVFGEAGLTPDYMDALRKPVNDLMLSRAARVRSAPTLRALSAVESAARRLRKNFKAISGPQSRYTSAVVAATMLESQLTFEPGRYSDDMAYQLDGNPIRLEIDALDALIAAVEAARRELPQFFPANKKGGQRAWSAVPAVFHALERVWTRVHTHRGATSERPAFLVVSHAVDSPFRRIVDACYREAGLVDGVPKKAFEVFVTERNRQRKELRRAIGAAWDSEQTRIRNE